MGSSELRCIDVMLVYLWGNMGLTWLRIFFIGLRMKVL